MKTKLSSTIYLLFALLFIGQITKDSFSQDSDSQSSIETPWGESGDEDSKSKDSDNEEDDKAFYSNEDQPVNSFTLLRHSTHYCQNRIEQIREIASPPPKA